jgi:hypothetical protein
MKSVCIFLLCAFLWGAYAIRRQIRLYGWSWWRVPLVAAVNTALWPLCMVIAIIRGE